MYRRGGARNFVSPQALRLHAEDAPEGVGYSDAEMAALLAGCEEQERDLDDPRPEPPWRHVDPRRSPAAMRRLDEAGGDGAVDGRRGGDAARHGRASLGGTGDDDVTNHPAEHHQRSGSEQRPARESARDADLCGSALSHLVWPVATDYGSSVSSNSAARAAAARAARIRCALAGSWRRHEGGSPSWRRSAPLRAGGAGWIVRRGAPPRHAS